MVLTRRMSGVVPDGDPTQPKTPSRLSRKTTRHDDVGEQIALLFRMHPYVPYPQPREPRPPRPPPGADSRWLAKDPSKRFGELVWLFYSPFWQIWLLGVIVPFKLYDSMDSLSYMLVGLGIALPCAALPWWLQGGAERARPWHERWWVKANVWIGVYSFIGNYFWTHYFYQLLGADYTFPSEYQRLNNVPFSMYLCTHGYFAFYHVAANLLMRKVQTHLRSRGKSVARQRAAVGAVVFLLAYVLAFLETWTISNFPYYTHQDKGAMYTVGSLFYAIYFFVSFPMFYRIDEDTSRGARRWTAADCALDALAAGMLCTIVLDLWRISLGAIPGGGPGGAGGSGLIWSGP